MNKLLLSGCIQNIIKLNPVMSMIYLQQKCASRAPDIIPIKLKDQLFLGSDTFFSDCISIVGRIQVGHIKCYKRETLVYGYALQILPADNDQKNEFHGSGKLYNTQFFKEADGECMLEGILCVEHGKQSRPFKRYYRIPVLFYGTQAELVSGCTFGQSIKVDGAFRPFRRDKKSKMTCSVFVNQVTLI